MTKMQLMEDINEEVISGEDLVNVLYAAKKLMEWPVPEDEGYPIEFEEDWNHLKDIVESI